jgi:hypothetical protein
LTPLLERQLVALERLGGATVPHLTPEGESLLGRLAHRH